METRIARFGRVLPSSAMLRKARELLQHDQRENCPPADMRPETSVASSPYFTRGRRELPEHSASKRNAGVMVCLDDFLVVAEQS